MAEAKQPAQKRSGWYSAAWVMANFLFHTILPVRYHHAERMQGAGAFILIANHQSWIDPLIMAAPVKRQITFLGKKELGKIAFVRRIIDSMHAILVDRHNTDMEAMRACIRTLREGNILGIFPEGTRYHAGVMDELEGGAAMIALRSGVPVIPVYIPRKLKLLRPVDCYVGEPIAYDDLREMGVNAETCKAMLARITSIYADMMKKVGE